MAMKIGTQLPSFEGATEWFGGTQAHVESETAGRPTLVHFWSASCGICKDNLPRVGYDTDVETVRDLIGKYGIVEPVAVDNEHRLKDAFQNDQGYVPAYYLFDAEGKLRSFAAGERGLDMLKTAIERVLSVQEPAVSS